MKRIFAFLSVVTFSAVILAQSPDAFKYQAIVRNNSGNTINNKQVSLRISILKNSITGSSIYSETFSQFTNAFGLVSLEIGKGTTTFGNFNSIDWGSGEFFLSIEMDENGGSDYTKIGTSQLLSVPFALYAKKAGNGFSGDYNDLINKPIYHDSILFVTGKFIFSMKIDTNGNIVVTKLVNTVDDADGNTYNTIRIGTQIWMAENLKTTKYNDGSAIACVPGDAEWYVNTTGAYCWYNNDSATYSATYGAIYNWYAVSPASNGGKNVCPVGWHAPNDEEWAILVNYLGGESVAGGKLKEAGTAHWNSPNTDADNSSGFKALPGGYRNGYGSFVGIGERGIFWNSSIDLATLFGWYRDLININGYAKSNKCGREGGFSVRCLKN